MEITQTQPYNGFFLQEPVSFSTPIVVLTGRNGSGKTRFIESLQQGLSIAKIDGNQPNQTSIRLITQQNIYPNLGGGYSNIERENRIQNILSFYNMVKNNLSEPLQQENRTILLRDAAYGISYIHMYNIANFISQKINKSINQLTHEEIILHFNESPGEIFGTTDISTISNTYIKKITHQ